MSVAVAPRRRSPGAPTTQRPLAPLRVAVGQGGEDFVLPADVITQTLGILAVKRAGKSNAAVVIAEALFDAGLPWVAIDPKGDWWGMRAAGEDGQHPGLPILVFGGKHGDVPLEATGGKLVAEVIVEQRLTCVVDVSEFSRAEQRKFLTDFAERLYKINTEPLLVFCEEADEYIPQRVMADMARLVGAFEMLVKRGGFKGIGICLITQRSASLNKDVLTQIETLIAMRTPSPQDRKAILGWVEHWHVGKDAVDELPALDNGEAWVFSPQWLKFAGRVRFRRRRTFDSGATPAVGQVRRPAHLADVNVSELTERMAATIERAKADDPRELRKRIRELEGLTTIEAAAPRVVEVPVEVRVLVPALTPEERADVTRLADAVLEAAGIHARVTDRLEGLNRRLLEALAATPSATPSPSPPTSAPPSLRPAPTPTSAPSTSPPSSPPSSNPHVPPARQRLLDAIAWWEALGVADPDRRMVAFIAGVSSKSSGYENNVSGLRSAGLLDYPGAGRLALTAAGRDRASMSDVPATRSGYHGMVLQALPPALQRLLRILIADYPTPSTRDALASRAGVSAASSGFENNVSRLRGLGLLDYPAAGQVRAAEMLFVLP